MVWNMCHGSLIPENNNFEPNPASQIQVEFIDIDPVINPCGCTTLPSPIVTTAQRNTIAVKIRPIINPQSMGYRYLTKYILLNKYILCHVMEDTLIMEITKDH